MPEVLQPTIEGQPRDMSRAVAQYAFIIKEHGTPKEAWKMAVVDAGFTEAEQKKLRPMCDAVEKIEIEIRKG